MSDQKKPPLKLHRLNLVLTNADPKLFGVMPEGTRPARILNVKRLPGTGTLKIVLMVPEQTLEAAKAATDALLAASTEPADGNVSG